jgi:DNA invertase Pin-like site-specific DNA recombinase
MKIGYSRVSTSDQNLDLQINALKKEGCKKIYSEKQSAIKDRPELNKLIGHIRTGDTVVVWKLDRLGRSLKDLLFLIDEFHNNGVQFKSIKDNIDTSTSTGRLFFYIVASLSEYEREMIVERTKAGLEAARLKGRVGGRKKGLSKQALIKANAAKQMYLDNKLSVNDIAKTLSIGKSTLYRYLQAMDVEIRKYNLD